MSVLGITEMQYHLNCNDEAERNASAFLLIINMHENGRNTELREAVCIRLNILLRISTF
jgi:hypothetical protein